MTTSQVCPLCEAGVLQPQTVMTAFEYRGQSAELPTELLVCNYCGSEQAGAVELRNNKRAMMGFRKSVDGVLTGRQVQALRARLGLTQAQAALVFGGGPVAFSKYESDDVAQSEAMDTLLRLADAVPEAIRWLRARAGLPTTAAPEGDWTDLVSATGMPVVDCGPRPQLKLVRSNDWVPQQELERKYA